MEREEIFGAIIVLVIIIVVALIVLNMGDVGGDINRIADEVFGWTKQKELEQTMEAAEQESKFFIDRIFGIYKHSLENKQAGCTYDTRGVALSDKYKVEVVYYSSGQTLVKFNLFDVKENKLIITKTIEKNVGNEWLMPCFNTNKDLNAIDPAGDRVEITYTSEGLKAGTNKLYEDLPKFYKKDQTHLCFATPKKNTAEYKKPLTDLKDCESGMVKGAEIGTDFFASFIASINACKALAKGEECKCDPISFDKLPVGGTIKATQKGDSLNFEFYLNGQKVENVERKLEGTKGVMITLDGTFGFLKKGLRYDELTEKEFNSNTKMLYLALTKNKEIGFAEESAAEPGWFRRNIVSADELKSCAPTYEVRDTNCKRKIDPSPVIKKIVDNKYDQIIKKATNDGMERMLLAAIIATESGGRNDAVSKSNCVGLMQFEAKTATGFSIPCDKGKCYVCDPKGCSVQDNRAKPEIAIPAGLQLLKNKIAAIDKCAGTTTYREIFGLAAYNAGEGVLCSAIKETGKQDPTWEEVKEKLNTDLLKRYYKGSYWTAENLKGKVVEIGCYPYYIETYRTVFTDRLFQEKS